MTRMIKMLCGAAFGATLLVAAAHAAGADATAARQALAQAGEMQAHAMRLDDGWLTTQAALKQAHAAFAKHDYNRALAEAQHAQKLARISIAQAEAQKKLWRNEIPQ